VIFRRDTLRKGGFELRLLVQPLPVSRKYGVEAVQAEDSVDVKAKGGSSCQFLLDI